VPDFQQFSLVRNGTVSLPNAPQWKFELLITDSTTGETLHDFTGANALFFPQILGQLTPEQQDEFVAHSVNWLIHKRAGTD
jgi:hypothetical protein